MSTTMGFSAKNSPTHKQLKITLRTSDGALLYLAFCVFVVVFLLVGWSRDAAPWQMERINAAALKDAITQSNLREAKLDSVITKYEQRQVILDHLRRNGVFCYSPTYRDFLVTTNEQGEACLEYEPAFYHGLPAAFLVILFLVMIRVERTATIDDDTYTSD